MDKMEEIGLSRRKSVQWEKVLIQSTNEALVKPG